MSNKFLSSKKDAAAVNMKVFLYSSLFIGMIGGALRSLAYLTSFENDIGYFNGSLLPTSVTYLIIIGCIFAFCGSFFIAGGADLPKKLDNKPNSIFFTSCFAGFIMLADFAYKIFYTIGEDKLAYYKTIFSPEFKSDNTYFIRATAAIEIFGILASLLSAVYFFIRASKKADNRSAIWFGFFPILRALVGVASIYFEMSIQMNHPSKLMLQFALIAVMLHLLYEERFGVSEDHPRPRTYFVTGCIAFILSFAGGLSEMVGFFTGNLKNGNFAVEAFFCLTISFYILARLNSFVRDTDKKPETEEYAE